MTTLPISRAVALSAILLGTSGRAASPIGVQVRHLPGGVALKSLNSAHSTTFLCVAGSSGLRVYLSAVNLKVTLRQASLDPSRGEIGPGGAPDAPVARGEVHLRCENGLLKLEAGSDITLINSDDAPTQDAPGHT